ncbi:MAG: DUF2306 domain-containing protein [Sulfitobacter sp.]|nr:DUF2306 domain-containing protein [Sulfitobacter sp.]
MTIQSIDPPQKQAAGLSKSVLLWGVLCVALAFYSLLVWDAGYKLLPQNHDPAHAQLIDAIEAKSNQGVPYSEIAEDAREAYPLWNNLTAMVTGTYFGFGSNGNSDPVRYYNSMEPVEKSALSLHMVLGGAVLILGMFQFTPSFRKKHRKAHRAIGGIYVLALFVMSFAAIYHMVHTGIENTYQGFAFHIQLWFLATSTIIAQVLAIYFIKKRNFALHLGFQIYTFSAFLNAPIQRYDWVVFGKIYPHLTLGEVNNLVNILTFWQCLLIGYLLFAWNRAAAPLRAKPVEIVAAPTGLKVFLTLAATAAVLTSLAMYVGSAGLSEWTVAQTIAPASTLAAEAALYAGKSLQTAAFGILIAAAIISGIWLMIRDETSRLARNVFYVSAVAAGVQQVLWGLQLGEPSMAVTSGGGFYIVSGLSLAMFALLAVFFQMQGRDHLWHEIMVFAVNFAFAPALIVWGHGLWYLLDVIPAFYIDRGHGYVLAAGAAILTPTFNGFIGMMTSRETQSRAIS